LAAPARKDRAAEVDLLGHASAGQVLVRMAGQRENERAAVRVPELVRHVLSGQLPVVQE
jgi:hypothetical protein